MQRHQIRIFQNHINDFLWAITKQTYRREENFC